MLRLDIGNPTWGYRRIHGEIRRLGHRLAASPVWKILRDAGCEPTPNRTGAWTTQAARNLMMGYDKAIRFVIRDGAGQYTRSFDDVFTAIGAEAITIPPGAPRANAFAERWVRTVRHELLDRTLIWNQRQLSRLLEDFIEHRPRQSLSQRAPNDQADKPAIDPATPIHRSTTCTGLINEYRRAA